MGWTQTGRKSGRIIKTTARLIKLADEGQWSVLWTTFGSDRNISCKRRIKKLELVCIMQHYYNYEMSHLLHVARFSPSNINPKPRSIV